MMPRKIHLHPFAELLVIYSLQDSVCIVEARRETTENGTGGGLGSRRPPKGLYPESTKATGDFGVRVKGSYTQQSSRPSSRQQPPSLSLSRAQP